MYRTMTKINFKNTKISDTTIAILVIAMIVLSPTMLLPQLSWAATTNSSLRVPDSIQQSQAPPADPTLSDTDKKDIANAVLNISGVRAWSDQWQVAGMGYLGTKSGNSVTWNDAIVVLRLPANASAPVSCNVGWTAWAKVDLSTKQVLEATYPTRSSNQCDANELGMSSMNGKKSPTDPPGFSIGTQNDVNGTNWYGNYAVIETPSYSGTIYNHITGLIAQILNDWWDTTLCSGGPCFTQAGWEITPFACTACGISANSTDVVYVDQSSTGTQQGYNTGISWSSGTTEQAQISCPSGSTYYKIHISYGTSTFNWTTKVPCGTAQKQSDTLDNSVFFENHNTGSSSNWSGDVTGSVLGTSAEEYDNTNTAYYWSTSNNVDLDCSSNLYQSTVMTGSLASDQNAYWTYLSNVAHAC